MEHARAVAQVAVRDQLGGIERVDAAQHPASQDDQPAVLEHPHLAPVLALVVRRRPLEGDGLGVVDGAPATLDHQVREGQIVAEARVDVHVVPASHRVDGAVASGHRAELRLGRAEAELVAPVGALAVRSVRAVQAELAADVRDVAVGEVPYELAQSRGRPRRVRVREREDLAAALPHGAVLRRDLAPALATEEADARLACGDRLDQLVGTIRRGVGSDDDLDQLRRIVELKQVLQPALDHGLLVVRGDDDADGRHGAPLAHGSRPHAGEQSRSGGVADVRPGERAERAPEDRLHQHGAPS